MAALAGTRRTPLGHVYGALPRGNPFTDAASGTGRHTLVSGPDGSDLVVFDLTTCDRFGIKGRGACDWLSANGLEPPEHINRLAPTPSGELDIVRLGREDFVILSRPEAQSSAVMALKAQWEQDAACPKGFDSWRDEVWAWFHICGQDVSRLMAKTCPVDLHRDRFALAHVAQTRVAQMDCIVVRTDRHGGHGFDVFFDVTSSDFFLSSLKSLVKS